MTAQIHERLILDGEQTSMASCPDLPRDHPRLLQRSSEAALANGEDSILFSTACWRGYQGTWEIEDDVLYLVDVRGGWILRGEGRLEADWFSGELRVPRGELLNYIHMGFASTYEEELILTIEEGAVVDRQVIDNRR